VPVVVPRTGRTEAASQSRDAAAMICSNDVPPPPRPVAVPTGAAAACNTARDRWGLRYRNPELHRVATAWGHTVVTSKPTSTAPPHHCTRPIHLAPLQHVVLLVSPRPAPPTCSASPGPGACSARCCRRCCWHQWSHVFQPTEPLHANPYTYTRTSVLWTRSDGHPHPACSALCSQLRPHRCLDLRR
jgi:hypothetical protein